jgi:uncharacterized membrane protein
MKSILVLSLIIVFMVIGYLINKWLQQLVLPRQSLGRLFLYFLTVLISVFILSFLMVFVIGKLYPNELIK